MMSESFRDGGDKRAAERLQGADYVRVVSTTALNSSPCTHPQPRLRGRVGPGSFGHSEFDVCVRRLNSGYRY